VIGDLVFQPQSAEPAVGKIEVHFLAQPPLRADAEAIADKQHSDHELRIDRRAPRVAEELKPGAAAAR
jgi:hypothetical protein